MAKRKSAPVKTSKPRSFSGVIRERTREIQVIAKALRELVYEELPDAEETFYGGTRPMAMYRTTADVCWVQPQLRWCNIYFLRGAELTDPDRILEGSSDRFKHVKVRSMDDIHALPIRTWLQESVALNEAAVSGGLKFEQVLAKLQKICLVLPDTKETETWGKPHFRVGEKIFCGCGEDKGRPVLGLKMEAEQSEVMMKLPGIEKAPYSRRGDGWVAIDPGRFDDWKEIEDLIVGSYCLIAPKRTVASLDVRAGGTKASPRRKKSTKRSK